MKLNTTLFGMILLAIIFVSYAWMWYVGEKIPAWHAMMWVWIVFVQDLIDYLEK